MIAEGQIDWGGRPPQANIKGQKLHEYTSELHSFVRQVRGGILAGGFAVERMLSASIVHYFLGSRVNNTEVYETFDDGILEKLTFERRISISLMIAKKYFSPVDYKTMEESFGSLRTLRNAMAHNPFWLHPEFDEEGVLINLVPAMRRGKGVIGLTTEFVEKQNRGVQRAIGYAETLFSVVVGITKNEITATLLTREPDESSGEPLTAP